MRTIFKVAPIAVGIGALAVTAGVVVGASAIAYQSYRTTGSPIPETVRNIPAKIRNIPCCNIGDTIAGYRSLAENRP
jgi:hypothetical protein